MTIEDAETASAKRCSLLRRRLDLSVDAFREHWARPHATIACTMPGIARYTQNRIVEPLWERHEGADAFRCDGIVELEFRDGSALAEAGSSEAVRRLLPEDELRFLDAITLCNVQAGARQTWPGKVKIMLPAALHEAGSAMTLQQTLDLSGCIGSSVDRVSATAHRDRLGYETRPPHVFITLWFDPEQPLEAIFEPHSPFIRSAAPIIERGTAWRIDPLSIVG